MADRQRVRRRILRSRYEGAIPAVAQSPLRDSRQFKRAVDYDLPERLREKIGNNIVAPEFAQVEFSRASVWLQGTRTSSRPPQFRAFMASKLSPKRDTETPRRLAGAVSSPMRKAPVAHSAACGPL